MPPEHRSRYCTHPPSPQKAGELVKEEMEEGVNTDYMLAVCMAEAGRLYSVCMYVICIPSACTRPSTTTSHPSILSSRLLWLASPYRVAGQAICCCYFHPSPFILSSGTGSSSYMFASWVFEIGSSMIDRWIVSCAGSQPTIAIHRGCCTSAAHKIPAAAKGWSTYKCLLACYVLSSDLPWRVQLPYPPGIW